MLDDVTMILMPYPIWSTVGMRFCLLILLTLAGAVVYCDFNFPSEKSLRYVARCLKLSVLQKMHVDRKIVLAKHPYPSSAVPNL